MKKYEAVFILDERKVEDGGEIFANEVAVLIESLGGQLTQKLPMGRRQFAYMIKKKRAGIYWDFVFELNPAKVGAFKEHYRLNSTVLRMQAFNYEEPPPASDRKDADLSFA